MNVELKIEVELRDVKMEVRVFHKLHFAKKKDAIPVRTPHGCI